VARSVAAVSANIGTTTADGGDLGGAADLGGGGSDLAPSGSFEVADESGPSLGTQDDDPVGASRGLLSPSVLTVIEGRVLGSLLEKERTTPDQYPLSLNALVSACNQSSSREPVMSVDAHDAERAIESLKMQRLARIVHPSHGGRSTRFRQVADETYGWTPEQAAVMTLLLLRGPQTSGELRTRSDRLHAFTSVDDVDRVLAELAAREEPHVVRLERQVGQKEARWQQQIAEEPEIVAAAPRAAVAPVGGLADRVAELEARVARLEAALESLL
jgi:uncharacterized protein